MTNYYSIFNSIKNAVFIITINTQNDDGNADDAFVVKNIQQQQQQYMMIFEWKYAYVYMFFFKKCKNNKSFWYLAMAPNERLPK